MLNRIPVRSVVLLALFAGCDAEGPSDTDVDNVTPVCDGRKQEGEDAVDAPFDLDGDGFFDASNEDCAAAFPPNQLDCDDENPDVNPSKLELPCNGVDDDCREASPENPDSDEDGVGACEDCDDLNPQRTPGNEETCFDNTDNDCDGITDNDCGENYNGTFVLDEPINFTCGIPFPGLPISPIVQLDMSDMFVIWQPPNMTVGQTTSATPPPLEGLVDVDGSVALTLNEGALGDCQRAWSLEGTFLDDSRFEGTLSVNISGFLVCGTCPQMPQSWPVNATKQ